MQTRLPEDFLQTPAGEQANTILRSCVHCGFCNATCPTYQLLGDELDGPRGRIYLIKQALETGQATRETQIHLDRCLTCRNCETTCPSGVNYSHLLDIGRAAVNRRVKRPLRERLLFTALRGLLLNKALFAMLTRLGQTLRPVLPARLQASLPRHQAVADYRFGQHARKVLLIGGCVQPALQPAIDQAARIVFDRLGLQTLEPAVNQCCGALSHHLDAEDQALAIMRANIDRWWPLLQQHDIVAITMTASGCGVTLRDYARLLAHDPAYADKARVISARYRDPAEIVRDALATAPELQRRFAACGQGRRLAFHPPCTLQHGMQLKGVVEGILENCGFALRPIPDAHLCCGAAGAYSITQRELSRQLQRNKLDAIASTGAECLASANIGCLLQLQNAHMPVLHWLQLLQHAPEDEAQA